MSKTGTLRVLVVDDSPHTRRILRSVLESDPLVGVVDGAGNGKIALEKAFRRPPDLITLDLVMPVMDGFTFLRFFRARSHAPVLVVSSHGELSKVEQALLAGASGFISKPSDPYRNLSSIAEELRLKLRQHTQPARPERFSTPAAAGPKSRTAGSSRLPVIAIGSSSGGPSTLQYLLSSLPPRLQAAVLVAQHMPPGFTAAFAKRLDSILPYPIREARHGDLVRAGEVLVAPGGSHMTVSKDGPISSVAVEEPGDSLYVPSVDRLLETSAEAFGEDLTAVILTGMGKDGARGVEIVKKRKGRVIAESQETAAIFGMPREAAATGCVDELLPLPEIAVRLIRVCGGDDRTRPEG